LHTEERRASEGNVLARFLNLIEGIKDFLKPRSENFSSQVACLLVDLAVLTNVPDKWNSLNRQLQGRDKHVTQMIGAVKSFKA
jgi:hypothetical protein